MTVDSSTREQPWVPLLLADPSACLRWLVLRYLMARPSTDEEVVELAAQRPVDRLVSGLSSLQVADGSWPPHPEVGFGGAIQRTAQALMRLGFLGFDGDFPAVARGAQYLFSTQEYDGSWPLSPGDESREKYRKYDHIPLQTALPLRGLAACGYATHPNAERAYEWLLSMRLDDGAWPTGYVAGSRGYVAGYRRLAHSRWGCRSNTTAALVCLAAHPQRRHAPEAQQGLDLLLGRETSERHWIGFDTARLLGFEPVKGFFTYYGSFDLALVLKLCTAIGATTEDQRVARLVSTIEEIQGTYGLWQYTPNPTASRWVSYDLLRTLANLDDAPGWTSLEPRTPFTPYNARDERY